MTLTNAEDEDNENTEEEWENYENFEEIHARNAILNNYISITDNNNEGMKSAECDLAKMSSEEWESYENFDEIHKRHELLYNHAPLETPEKKKKITGNISKGRKRLNDSSDFVGLKRLKRSNESLIYVDGESPVSHTDNSESELENFDENHVDSSNDKEYDDGWKSPIFSDSYSDSSNSESEWENYENFDAIHARNAQINNYEIIGNYSGNHQITEKVPNSKGNPMKPKNLQIEDELERGEQWNKPNQSLSTSYWSMENQSNMNNGGESKIDIISSSIGKDSKKDLDPTVPNEYRFENPEFGELIYDEAYTEYKPSKLKIGRNHPYRVVESRSLTSMDGPDIQYQLKLPAVIIEKGLLSNVQLEAMIYSCQKHEQYLPDGNRAGFLIGDGAGVGKGRTIAGIILENYLTDRKRSVWVSVSNDLLEDARRDLNDIGREIDLMLPIQSLNKMNYNKINSKSNGSFSEGVLFTTYASLISSCRKSKGNRNTNRSMKTNAKSNKKSFERRLDQIIDWLGLDYDGVIVFDESHKAKNLFGKKTTKSGEIVKELQNTMKHARIVYASATGATEPKHMAYMVRLGLWGKRKPFEHFSQFMGALDSYGIAAMELIAIEMKMKGVYLARQLSFYGVKFDIREIPTGNSLINGIDFELVYSRSVALWTKFFDEFNLAFKRNQFPKFIQTMISGQFWGAHQRYFKYLCMSAKIEECIRVINEQIDNGKCVVIGLQSTGEARTIGALQDSSSASTVLDDFVSSAEGIVKSLIKDFYPTRLVLQKYQTINDNRRKKKSKKVSLDSEESEEDCEEFDLNGIGEETDEDAEEFVDLLNPDMAIRNDLLKRIKDMVKMFPVNILDHLIDGLGGPKFVAEMTGRKGRMVKTEGKVSYKLRKEDGYTLEKMNILEKNRFNSGEKLIAIISDAASTGISLHADKRFENQRQRVHMTLELPWSADKAIQQFGRTHRSNQIIPPHYIFLISDLPGEKRFAATVAKRLESLGALTHGDRRAADSADLSQFNLDNKFGLKAAKAIVESLLSFKPLDVPFPIKYMKPFDNSDNRFRKIARDAIVKVGMDAAKVITVTKFLNRILGLEIKVQNCLFQCFLDLIEHKMQQAKTRNEFDHGIRDIKNKEDIISIEETRILQIRNYHDDNNTLDNDIIIHKVKHITIGVSWEEALEIYYENPSMNQFCVSKRGFVKILALAQYQANNKYKLITIQFPPKFITAASLKSMYIKIESDNAMEQWKHIYAESLTNCMHVIGNESCGDENCIYGKRTKTNYIICGSVFFAWKIICATYQNLRMEVIRVELQNDMKLIGALVSNGNIKFFMNALMKKCKEIKYERFED